MALNRRDWLQLASMTAAAGGLSGEVAKAATGADANPAPASGPSRTCAKSSGRCRQSWCGPRIRRRVKAAVPVRGHPSCRIRLTGNDGLGS